MVRNAEVRDCNSPEEQEFTNDLLGRTGRANTWPNFAILGIFDNNSVVQ